MKKCITRKRMLVEVGIKNLLVILVFSAGYAPLSVSSMLQMDPAVQESVISLMGFLMAAAIIGAFELSYTRSNLNDIWQRYLAHITKFTLYTSILLLIQIALVAIQFNSGNIMHIMILASSPVALSLFLYDFWDALRALDDNSVTARAQ